MKQDLTRLKNDVETIQRALGLAPSFQQDWVQWMKRDNWFNLWWCLPGSIILASALLPINRAQTYLGLIPDQWTGILVAVSLLLIASIGTRRTTRKDGRPESLIRETKRLYGVTREGFLFSMAFAVQFLLFVIWSRQHHMAFDAFWTGLFLLAGTTFFVSAFAAKAWILLGYALPFVAYGLCLPLADGHQTAKTVLFGTMFITVAACFSIVQVWEIRKIQNAT